MTNHEDPQFTIDKEIAAFDADPETAIAESTIGKLILTYPTNLDSDQVLVKVITINALYHARVLDVDLLPLAKHIAGIEALDTRLEQGDPEVVDAIWYSQGTRHHYPSFATKFCNWHNSEAYAIYNGNVWEALVAYRTKGGLFDFSEREFVKYVTFLAIVRKFQSSYGLHSYSLKNVDKFLWRVGDRLIAERSNP